MRIRDLTIPLMLMTAACGQESTTPPAGAVTADLPAEQIIYDLRHRMTKDGLQVAVLNADTAYLHDAGTRFDLVGVRVEFYNEAGVPAGNLTSRTGEYDVREEQFVARGDAVLVTQTPEGERRLESSELHYSLTGDRLWSDSSFVMTEDGRTTRGTAFQSDGRFGTWQVTGGKTEGGLPAEGGLTF